MAMKMDKIGNQSRHTGGTSTAMAGASVVGAMALAHTASAQGGGVVLPGASVNVLANGNAMVSYNGKQFALPAGQFADVGGQLVVSMAVAQVFAPEAIAMQSTVQNTMAVAPQPVSAPQLTPQQSVLIEPLKTASAQSAPTYAAPSYPAPSAQFAPQPTYVAAPAPQAYIAPPTIEAVVPSTATPTPLIPSFGSFGNLLGGSSSTLIMLGGLAVAGGIAYMVLNEDGDDNSSTPTADTTAPTFTVPATISTSGLTNTSSSGSSVIGLSAFTSDTDIDTYEVVGGTASSFLAVSDTGAVTTTQGSLTAGTYTLQVKATDKSGNANTETFTFVVTDKINPTISVGSTTDQDNDAASGTTVATVTASDETTSTSALTYALTSSPSWLTVDSSGVVKTTGSMTSVSAGTYTYTVKVTDAAGNSASTAAQSITVADKTAPTLAGFSTTAATFGTASQIVDLAASDETSAASDITFSVASGSSLPTGFTLDSATGVVSYDGTGVVGAYNFDVVAIDQAGNQSAATTVSGTIGSAPANTAAPTSTPSTSLTTADTTALTISTADFGFADANGDNLGSVTIEVLPTSGQLELSGTAVTANQVITAADIAAGNLTFNPTAPTVNIGALTASFQYKVTDDSAAGTLTSTASYTMSVSVTDANEVPTATPVNTTVAEDTALALTAANFGVADADDAVNFVTIVSVTGGALSLSGAAVSVSQQILLADLGNLTFTPSADFNGTAEIQYAATDTDPTPATSAVATLQITVTAVDDTPVWKATVDDLELAETATTTTFSLANQLAGTHPADESDTFSFSPVGSASLNLSSGLNLDPSAGTFTVDAAGLNVGDYSYTFEINDPSSTTVPGAGGAAKTAADTQKAFNFIITANQVGLTGLAGQTLTGSSGDDVYDDSANNGTVTTDGAALVIETFFGGAASATDGTDTVIFGNDAGSNANGTNDAGTDTNISVSTGGEGDAITFGTGAARDGTTLTIDAGDGADTVTLGAGATEAGGTVTIELGPLDTDADTVVILGGVTAGTLGGGSITVSGMDLDGTDTIDLSGFGKTSADFTIANSGADLSVTSNDATFDFNLIITSAQVTDAGNILDF